MGLKAQGIIDEGIRCFCHTLQLVVTGALDTQVKPFLDRARALVKAFRTSTLLSDALRAAQKEAQMREDVFDGVEETNAELVEELPEQEQKSRPLKLLRDVMTRWWSTYRMLKRLAGMWRVVKVAISRTGKHDVDLSADDWLALPPLIDMLEPLAEAVRTLEGEKYVTLSTAWPIILSLRVTFSPGNEAYQRFVQAIDRTPLVYRVPLHNFLDFIAHDLQVRFVAVPDLCKVATLMDPRFAALDFVDGNTRTSVQWAAMHMHAEDCKLCQQQLQQQQQVQQPQQQQQQQQQPPQQQQPQQPPPQQEAQPFWARLRRAPGAGACGDCTFRQQLTSYVLEQVADHTNPLHWWRDNAARYPLLAVLARRVLCVPASSAPSERVFSHLNIVVEKRRSSILAGRAGKIALMRANKRLFRELN
jgi:hypothetical protein